MHIDQIHRQMIGHSQTSDSFVRHALSRRSRSRALASCAVTGAPDYLADQPQLNRVRYFEKKFGNALGGQHMAETFKRRKHRGKIASDNDRTAEWVAGLPQQINGGSVLRGPMMAYSLTQPMRTRVLAEQHKNASEEGTTDFAASIRDPQTLAMQTATPRRHYRLSRGSALAAQQNPGLPSLQHKRQPRDRSGYSSSWQSENSRQSF